MNKPLIYVVDDEPMVLELSTAILEPLGYALETFRDPEQALQAFATAPSPPALLITDYAMHAMNGLRLIEEVRRFRPTQKTLMVSGTVDQEVFRNTPTRPNSFLAKPYRAKELAEAVKELIE